MVHAAADELCTATCCDVEGDPVNACAIALAVSTTTSCNDSHFARLGTVPVIIGTLGGSSVDSWTPLAIILAHNLSFGSSIFLCFIFKNIAHFLFMLISLRWYMSFVIIVTC